MIEVQKWGAFTCRAEAAALQPSLESGSHVCLSLTKKDKEYSLPVIHLFLSARLLLLDKKQIWLVTFVTNQASSSPFTTFHMPLRRQLGLILSKAYFLYGNLSSESQPTQPSS